MLRLMKFLLALAVVAVIALVGYAYLGDMQPERRAVSIPVPVDVD